eukprot:Selendium_serpulae@DN5077_c0_g1_i1.p1
MAPHMTPNVSSISGTLLVPPGLFTKPVGTLGDTLGARASENGPLEVEIGSPRAVGTSQTCSTEGCHSLLSPSTETAMSVRNTSSDCSGEEAPIVSTIQSEELASAVRQHYATMANGDSPDNNNITHVLQQILGQRSLDMRNCALPSIGSVLHDEGICKPCVFANKNNKNCRNGAVCLFCHYDHKEKRRRSKRSKTLPICSGPITESAVAQSVQIPLLPQPPPKCGTQTLNCWRASHPNALVTGGPNLPFPSVQETRVAPGQPSNNLQRLEDQLPRSNLSHLSALRAHNGGRTLSVDGYFDIDRWGGDGGMTKPTFGSADWSAAWRRHPTSVPNATVQPMCFPSSENWLESGQDNQFGLPQALQHQDRFDNVHQWVPHDDANVGDLFTSETLTDNSHGILQSFASEYSSDVGFRRAQSASAYDSLSSLSSLIGFLDRTTEEQAPPPSQHSINERYKRLLDSVALAASPKASLPLSVLGEEFQHLPQPAFQYPSQHPPHLAFDPLEGLKGSGGISSSPEEGEISTLIPDPIPICNSNFHSALNAKGHPYTSVHQRNDNYMREVPSEIHSGVKHSIFGDVRNGSTIARNAALFQDNNATTNHGIELLPTEVRQPITHYDGGIHFSGANRVVNRRATPLSDINAGQYEDTADVAASLSQLIAQLRSMPTAPVS